MRVFELHRDEDPTGVSGTGVVAQGVEFDDGTVAMRWASDWPTSVVFHDDGIESVRQIHGHGGSTRIVFLGYNQQPLPDTPRPLAFTERGHGVWLQGMTDLDGQIVDVVAAPAPVENAVHLRVGSATATARLSVRQAAAVRDALNAWLVWLGDGSARS